jgi:hypothetical protein
MVVARVREMKRRNTPGEITPHIESGTLHYAFIDELRDSYTGMVTVIPRVATGPAPAIRRAGRIPSM